MLSHTRMLLSSLVILAGAVAAPPEVTLKGVVLARSGRHAATLTSDGRTRSVVAGEQAFGCEVLAIQEGSADLVCAGERRSLRLTRASPKPGSARLAAEAATATEPTDITLTRKDLEARLDLEMSRLMTETSLVPVTSRGQVTGFTLSRIPAGTILDTLGIKAGDTLVSVNQTPIDSFTTLVGLWPRLQSQGVIRAQILRDGKPLDISVSIK